MCMYGTINASTISNISSVRCKKSFQDSMSTLLAWTRFSRDEKPDIFLYWDNQSLGPKGSNVLATKTYAPNILQSIATWMNQFVNAKQKLFL
jgi:hypothetical protein